MLACALTFSANAAHGQQADAAVTLFNNVRIFDGKTATLSAASNVLIRGNLIERISQAPIAVDRSATTRIIDGGGRTLMPGLIDAHWHAMLIRLTPPAMLASDVGYTTLLAGAEATATLMRGFTTVRDMGGPAFSLKRAIDEGAVAGPRIYPSGAVITVTSGHGDFRNFTDLPRTIGGMLSRIEQLGGAMIADSPDEVRLRVREQLMQGASQIKLTAGGGVASPFAPLDASTFTEPELRAAVEAAENWGTYVCTHAYTPVSIQRSIAAGVKCIEHGHLMDDATARLIAEKGIWLSMQPFVDAAAASAMGPAEQARLRQVITGTEAVYALREEIQDQDGVGHRHPVLQGARRTARQRACRYDPLVHAGRSSDHGDVDECRIARLCPASAIRIPASSASWSRARWPICCWSTAIRWRTSSSSRSRTRRFLSS